MTTVETSYWDGIAEGVPEDTNLDDILNFDFALESLESEGLDEDLDISNSDLGPIPSDVSTCYLPVPQGNFSKPPSRPLDSTDSYQSKFKGAFASKQKPNQVRETSNMDITQHKSSEVQKSGAFQTQSPVSVLDSSGSCSGGKSMPIKLELTIPRRPRSERVRSAAVNPWLLIGPIFPAVSTKKASNARIVRDRKRKRLSHISVATETMPDQFEQKGLSQAPGFVENRKFLDQPVVTKKCAHCEVTKTPQWREGPAGPKTLCNACGVRYRSGRLYPEYRPAASPTFVPSLHSNSHRKVIEMRSKAIQEAAKVKNSPMSPEPEFVPMSSHLFDYIH